MDRPRLIVRSFAYLTWWIAAVYGDGGWFAVGVDNGYRPIIDQLIEMDWERGGKGWVSDVGWYSRYFDGGPRRGWREIDQKKRGTLRSAG